MCKTVFWTISNPHEIRLFDLLFTGGHTLNSGWKQFPQGDLSWLCVGRTWVICWEELELESDELWDCDYPEENY